MSDQQTIKEIIKQEYIKCATDPIHFFRKYGYISHPIKGKILFNLYPFQSDVLSKFHSNRFTIINKSRQLGISTLVAAYALWLMLFNKDKTILCIATKQETAKQMVDKVQFMFQNLPGWLKGKNKPISDNKLSLKLSNGSQIIATSAASDAGRSYAVSLLIIDEAAFINGIDKIYTSIKPTIATGGAIIALSSPNGIGGWFHKTYKEAEDGDNDFYPIELKWNLHPDRLAPIDPGWEERERSNMSPREFAQEYDCDFLGSGNSVVDPDILSFYEKTFIKDPIEKRFLGGDFWIWEYPDYNKPYIISADVARGDGSDNSAFHIIDVEECKQVAEYRSQIDTRSYGNMLVSVATEWNNALLVVENANIGWDVINTIIAKNYPNLYYSPRTYGDIDLNKWLDKMENNQTVPGFITSIKTRPLVISKMEAYIRDRQFTFYSRRLLEELRVFIWQNGKAQSQNGYHDDLVMALGIGLFTRDTGIKLNKQGMDITRASLNSMTKTGGNDPKMYNHPIGTLNPYRINTAFGTEDISWLVR